MSFDITKYKDWYWCETMENISRYFSKMNDTKELPLEYAKEVIIDCDDLIPIEGKPNHYHKKYQNCIGKRDYVIYAFKDKKIFQQVVEEYTNYINLESFLKKVNISFEDLLIEIEKVKDINKDIIYCAKCISLTISDTSTENYNDVVPISCKKYLEASLKILEKANKNNELDTFIDDCKYYIENDLFLYYHNFINPEIKFYK